MMLYFVFCKNPYDNKGVFKYRLFVENWKLITENTVEKSFLNHKTLLLHLLGVNWSMNSAMGLAKKTQNAHSSLSCRNPNAH